MFKISSPVAGNPYGGPVLVAAVEEARSCEGSFLLNFMVEKEDSVYPMIPAGSALHEMIRRPEKDPLEESADDK